MPDRAPRNWVAERTHHKVLTVTFTVEGPAWEGWVLLRSDAHHDNLHSDHDLEKRHLDQALDRGAAILDAGDLFCSMQGRYDKRADRNQLRPEHRGNDYFDALKRTAADFYAPYCLNWAMLAPGNHETATLKHHQTDLTAALAERMGEKSGHPAPQVMPYTGWVRFRFVSPPSAKSRSLLLWYTHGYGGGGPVTRDVIQSNRQAAFLSSVDIVWSGHTHDQWWLPVVREELGHDGTPRRRETQFVKTPGYKDEFASGEGYHLEKGRGPKPLGAAWLRFSKTRISRAQGLTEDFKATFVRAD